MDKVMFLDIVSHLLDNDDRPEWLQDMVHRKYWYYYRLFAKLAKHLNPDLIVELGTATGVGALHFRHGSSTARIVTVDIRQTTEQNTKRLKDHNIEYVIDDAAKAASLIDGPIDIIFFDANHEYDNVMAEVDAWMPKVKENGIALFDDIHYDIEKRPVGYLSKYNKVIPQGKATGMYKAWKEVSEQYGKEALDLDVLHPGVSFGVILL